MKYVILFIVLCCSLAAQTVAPSLVILGPSGSSGSSGSGDVVGPASSTDTAVALFSGTTGKLLQNSVVLIDSSGNITGIGNLSVTTLIAGSLSGAAFGTGIPTWLATPSSANLATAVTDEVGSGSLLFGDQAVRTTSAPTFSNVKVNMSVLTYNASTMAVDFSGDGQKMITVTGSGNITLTTSNLAAGKSETIYIFNDSATCNFTFPSWIFVGAAAPTSLAASKHAVLTLTSTGTTDAGVFAAYAAQP